MPRNVGKLITELENINIKLENIAEDYGMCDDDMLIMLGQVIDSLVEYNDELDSQVDE